MNAAGKEGVVPSNFLSPYTPPAGGAAASAGGRARGGKARSAGDEDDEEYDDETDGGGGGASVASQSLASQEPESLTETAADVGDEDGEEPSESATAPLGESLMHRTYAVELKLHLYATTSIVLCSNHKIDYFGIISISCFLQWEAVVFQGCHETPRCTTDIILCCHQAYILVDCFDLIKKNICFRNVGSNFRTSSFNGSDTGWLSRVKARYALLSAE